MRQTQKALPQLLLNYSPHTRYDALEIVPVHMLHDHCTLQTHNIDVMLPATYRHTAEELLEKVRRQSDASDGGSSSASAPSLTASAAKSVLKAVHGRRSRTRSTGGSAARSAASAPPPPSLQAERVPGELSADSALPAAPPVHSNGIYTAEEVAQHNKVDDCWLIADGVVYDVTSFLAEHPAGVAAIMRHAGKESSEDFQFHSQNAQRLWREYKVGTLEGHKKGCTIM